VAGPLTRGNTAKLYCLQLIDEAAARAEGEFRILDLGCGDGRNFVELLRRRDNVRYVGVEPSRAAAAEARRRLPGAEIVNAPAYDIRVESADAVVSFSVLEHVVDRARYFEAVHANLAPDGRVYMNYDSGHFGADATLGERVRAVAGRVLALAGDESRYRARVAEDELRRLIADASLRILDDKGFNTELKLTYRNVPEERKDTFTEQWLAFELELNAVGIGYDERLFRTRNVILATAARNGPQARPDLR
jgi:SAM-dependent methyltransferase